MNKLIEYGLEVAKVGKILLDPEIKTPTPQRVLTGATHYWPRAALPFAYAMSCTQVVLIHGKADKPYQEAKEAWGLPDCKLATRDFRAAYADKKETNCPHGDLHKERRNRGDAL